MPVGSFTLCANIFFAYHFFGETLSRQDIFGTVLIIIGAVNVAVAYGVLGDVPEQCFDLRALIALFDSHMMWLYGLLVFSMMGGFLLVIKRCEGLLQSIADLQCDTNDQDAADSVAHKLRDGPKGRAAAELLRLQEEYKRFQRLHPTAYAAVSGMFGSCSILFASCTMQMVKMTSKGSNQFVYW